MCVYPTDRICHSTVCRTHHCPRRSPSETRRPPRYCAARCRMEDALYSSGASFPSPLPVVPVSCCNNCRFWCARSLNNVIRHQDYSQLHSGHVFGRSLFVGSTYLSSPLSPGFVFVLPCFFFAGFRGWCNLQFASSEHFPVSTNSRQM